MSNVLLRNRSVSDLEFFKNGIEIRKDFVRYLMSEKHVPKRWRPVFTFPGINLAIKMMEEITAANTIYPTNEDEMKRRRYHQENAIIACEQIIQHIQWMNDTLDGVSLNDFKVLGEKIIKEVTLLKAWRKKNKVLTQKF
jgi:hypothetical protein